MYTMCRGSRFLGYGRNVVCENCNNRVTERIYYSFDEHGIMYIRIPFLSDTSLPSVICPVCHSFTTPSMKLISLNETVEYGKHHTKKYFDKLSWIQKRKYKQDLKKLIKNGNNELEQLYIFLTEQELTGLNSSVVSADRISCPFCAELIKKEAEICRFCNRNVS